LTNAEALSAGQQEKGIAIHHRKGELVKRVEEEEIVSAVLEEVEKF